MDAARVVELYGIIGVELFGEDTYRDPDIPRPILKEELAKLISAIVRSEERRVGKECRSRCDWSSDVCSSDLGIIGVELFGEDTYRDPDIPRPILKEELAKLISAIV